LHEINSFSIYLQKSFGETSVIFWHKVIVALELPLKGQHQLMTDVLDYAPIAAAAFAIPQFLPQIRRLQATRDTAGVSWSWAALVTLNNAAWIGYFALYRYWTALVPASSVTLLAGTLTMMLTGRSPVKPRQAAMIGACAAALAAAYAIAGRDGLGTLLTMASIVQVMPSIWTAYRTTRPTGISAGTWTLILGELSCFLAFGLHESDPRLIILGASGVIASTLMLARIYRAGSWACAGSGRSAAR
jgi:hypothetical protein